MEQTLTTNSTPNTQKGWEIVKAKEKIILALFKGTTDRITGKMIK